MNELKLPAEGPGFDAVLVKSPEVSVALHKHRFYELVYIYSGSGRHVTGQGEYEISPGDIFLIPPGSAHGYRERRGMSLINIAFEPSRLPVDFSVLRELEGFHAFFETAPSLRDDFRFRNKLTLYDEDREFCEKLTHELEYELRSRLPGWELSLAAILARLFVLIARACSSIRRGGTRDLMKLDKIILRMKKGMRTGADIPKLARSCGVSQKNMERLFACALRCTPIAYWNDLKLNEAARLLRDTGYPVGAIAEETGFPDSNYFTRLFARKYSVSPRAYRKKFAGGRAGREEEGNGA